MRRHTEILHPLHPFYHLHSLIYRHRTLSCSHRHKLHSQCPFAYVQYTQPSLLGSGTILPLKVAEDILDGSQFNYCMVNQHTYIHAHTPVNLPNTVMWAKKKQNKQM